ncbi:hydroxysteroid dehydrogenase-like protein 2 [Rissa tridactyla]|uniref:hydroxysteroid dehydrogenase-like protein 2 n=1 Tax=Rissa tridactyla TaxID=75485 RepID=UPI0023BAEE18|nr:hydroxysteroid dehydrogenase-like protein 2 [Rissa tridactyla]
MPSCRWLSQGASQAFKEEKKLSQHEGADGAKASTESASAKPQSPVAETFRVIQGAMSEEYVRTTQGVFQFELSGEEGGTWYIDLKTKGGSAGFGKPPVTADVVMSMSSADFVKMFTVQFQLLVWVFFPVLSRPGSAPAAGRGSSPHTGGSGRAPAATDPGTLSPSGPRAPQKALVLPGLQQAR